ncbi:uncharacterized protein ACUXIR_000472 [Staphylococcus hominis]
MNKALSHFYYQFHTHQHYFLCHDILEESWKSKPNFSKKDAIVSLILFSTAMYHYRRHNKLGALKSFKKALYTFNHAKDKETLGLKVNEFTLLIQKQIEKVKLNQEFQPLKLPIKSCVEQEIINLYPNYEYNSQINTDDIIVHHHRLRDRSDVIAARKEALKNKRKKS